MQYNFFKYKIFQSIGNNNVAGELNGYRRCKHLFELLTNLMNLLLYLLKVATNIQG